MQWLLYLFLIIFMVIVPAQRQAPDPLLPSQRTAPLDEDEKSHHEHRAGERRVAEHQPTPEPRIARFQRTTVAHMRPVGFRTIIDPRATELRWGISERRLN